MRKIDYVTLAAIIKLEIEKAESEESIESEGAYFALIRVARNFANSASVKKVEFLKACGIK